MSRQTRQFLKTRHTLLARLKNWDDNESWEEFFDIYWGLIYNTALKMGLTEPEAEEAVQETMISVAKKIKEFQCDPAAGSFKAWLLKLTRWRIQDILRKRQPPAEPLHKKDTSTNHISLEETIPSPDGHEIEKIWDAEWEETLLDAALKKVKKTVSPQQFQIFHLYVVKKQPVSKITKALGVSATSVYLAKHRVGKLVQKEIKRLQNNPI